jgi:hypothetical protein
VVEVANGLAVGAVVVADGDDSAGVCGTETAAASGRLSLSGWALPGGRTPTANSETTTAPAPTGSSANHRRLLMRRYRLGQLSLKASIPVNHHFGGLRPRCRW